jgi:hypothetical protein
MGLHRGLLWAVFIPFTWASSLPVLSIPEGAGGASAIDTPRPGDDVLWSIRIQLHRRGSGHVTNSTFELRAGDPVGLSIDHFAER